MKKNMNHMALNKRANTPSKLNAETPKNDSKDRQLFLL